MKTNSKNYVSNNTGDQLELYLEIGPSDINNNSLRLKRDLSQVDDVIDVPPVKKRKRIVKKLVRVQLRNKSESDIGSSTETNEVETSTRRARRRLKVKKKKKKRLLTVNTIKSSDIDSEEHLQQATKPRRKIVITRKRLLPKASKSATTVAIELSTTATMAVESTDTHLRKEDITTELDENWDVTEENFIDYDSDDYSEHLPTENTVAINRDETTNYVGDIEDTSEPLPSIESPKNEITLETINGSNNNDQYDSEESRLDEYEDVTEENLIEDNDDDAEIPTFQSIPEYEPFFPELTESLDAPILLLKTTVLSSVELQTKTVVQSRLRTYTFIVTRVHGNEQIVTSTTEVKPQIKTSVLTESLTKYTTLTLLDFDATQTLTELQTTTIPTLDNSPPQLLNQENAGRGYEEARYNLATRVMSNGVEVIVAGDKTTLPGKPDVKRVAPTNVQKPVTLKPSTLTDHMVMILPQQSANHNGLESSLYPNQFVTKTCLTTFTYLTTYLEGSTTTVSSHEQVVSNIATEERNTGKILPTPAMGITLTQYPNLSVGVFHTTYTYLNTILDGEQPLVVSSKHTVTNTVTAPDDYLSLLKPSYTVPAITDTNTYYSTVALEKTLYEGDKSSVVSTNEVVTQVVITESVPPRATSVMTSYIALDMEDPSSMPASSYSTTDVVKTYFVTYTYFNTIMENGKKVVNTNVSTSSDVVTEKLYLYPKKTNSIAVNSVSVSKDDKKKHKIDLSIENFHILAAKTYFTTFTYLTTMLQENHPESPTVINSRTRVVENLVTETVNLNQLDKKYLNILRSEILDGSNSITKVATLQDGQKLEITAIANDPQDKIKPTKVLPIEKTKDPEIISTSEPFVAPSSSSVITGSTIVFVDDDPFAQFLPTPTLDNKSKTATLKNNLGSLLSSEIVKDTTVLTTINKTKRSTKTKVKTQSNAISPSKTKVSNQQTPITDKNKTPTPAPNKRRPQNDKKKQNTGTKVVKQPATPAADLLGLGSINMQALTPVLNAMAGLISTNLKPNRRNDVNVTTTTTKPKLSSKKDGQLVPTADIQNRSPIYIPVGGLGDDFEIAESQNIATFDWVDPPSQLPGKTTHEASLLNGGIPISPGEVITANSDVIVGKPGRIGPRIPTIPLNHINTETDVPIGMKPPPLPNNIWTKNNHANRHIPVANIRNDKPSPNIIHAPTNDDYVGPPPPSPVKENPRGDKRKHIPLIPPRKEAQYFNAEHFSSNTRYGSNNEIPLNQHSYHAGNENYGPIFASNEVNHVVSLPNSQHSIQQNYESVVKHSYPTYVQNQAFIQPEASINDFNIKPPSVINEPLVLPEVIERSTGQPLLVNIQPSQVAFVNIPFNRTTALIYGGSTEPHKNGQYFDDPSPYPEPEFSGIEFNDGIPHMASVYHDEASSQKQVNGVIKVGNQIINIEPDSSEQTVKLNIKPTKPQQDVQVAFGSNHEISVNVPPISFGLVNQDNDVNAHIINHGGIHFRPPATPYEVVKEEQHQGSGGYQKIPFQDFNKLEIRRPPNDASMKKPSYINHLDNRPLANEVRPNIPQLHGIPDSRRPTYQQKHHPSNNLLNIKSEYSTPSVEDKKPYHNVHGTPFPPKRYNLRPRPQKPERPNMEISEYMTPPPPAARITLPKLPYNRRPSKRPLPIPLSPNQGTGQIYNIPRPENTFSQPYVPSHIPSINLDIGDHRDDDLENEEGEVIQESNSRPLLPGEVPLEILKAKTTTTTGRSVIKSNNTIRFPSEEQFKFPNYNNEIINHKPIILHDARPFLSSESDTRIRPENGFVRPHIPISKPKNPLLRPGNQQTNEINHFDSEIKQPSGFTTEKPVYSSQNPTQKHKNSPSGFVIVGSQFEDPGDGYVVVSGNQFTNIVGHVNKNTDGGENHYASTYKPSSTLKSTTVTIKPHGTSTPSYPAFIENTLDNVFGFNTKNPIPIYRPQTTKATTQKPVIIYINDKVENKENFYNRKNNKHTNTDRPTVTSLPIDTHTDHVQNVPLHGNLTNGINTQTEKPFVPNRNLSQPTNEVNIIDDMTSIEPLKISTISTFHAATPELNTGEVTIPYTNVSTEISDMEIMKPPPLVTDLPVKVPDEDMQPPKIEVDSHGGDILRVPNIQSDPGSIDRNSSPKPYVPKPLEEMMPPPQTTTDEEVLGMSPPPLVSTHKPIISNKPITTQKPVFSVQIDLPKAPVVKPSTSTTTEIYNKFSRPRRPYTRKPDHYRPSTTMSATSDAGIYNRRPIYPVYNVLNRGTTTTTTTPQPSKEIVIIPSPTIKTKPSLEVIIGHPSLDIEGSTTPKFNAENKKDVELSGSEVHLKEMVTEKTLLLNRDTSDLLLLESGIPTSNYGIRSWEPSSKKDIVTQAIHHAGNEIKVVDETVDASVTTSKQVVPTITKDSKPVLPTRYITYTKTSTVTITKTTVIKTLGGPPSTLTILVTKTETSTIVDTVTEVHTLLKPTNVIETITTTVQQGSSLYPPDLYGSPYPSIQVKPSPTISPVRQSESTLPDVPEDDLDEFIIKETDAPPRNKNNEDDLNNNDSILVVMTDKNTKGVVKVPSGSSETQERDEMITNNKVNNILLAGILGGGHPNREIPETKSDRCQPECKATRNELCQKVDGVMRCLCRPGFARMFPDRPCLPTYTYNLRITLDRIGKDHLHYFDDLGDSNSTEFVKFAQATREALDRMVMQSDVRDIFHGVQVYSFGPGPTTKGIVTRFYLQLSDNIDEIRLEDIFKKYLRNNNYSLGGTDIFASPQSIEELKVQDFDECSFAKFHDCSENAQCFNLRGTYTCSCKEGYSDLSENLLYPGRVCSAEQVGCERCNYHGTCYTREEDEIFCECFQWYTGESCHINLKVLLIALVTLGAILFILLLVCLILTCARRKPRQNGVAAGMSFFPQRVGSSGNRGTLDRRAMIQDTSSEDSRSETNTLPYVQQKQKKPKGALKKTSKVSMQHPIDVENGTNTISFPDQKDRSLTVMIPRAKYHPAPPTSPLMNYTTFDARKPSVPSVSEAKLLSYLDAGPSPSKSEAKRKYSNTPSEVLIEEKPTSRKTSGALVSAGFEVSATVVNTMGTLGTTCGTEADRSENATLIQKISADLLSSTGTRSQFNTLRKSLVDDDLESSSNWLDIIPRVTTVSEARSYDETTIPPPMKSFRTDYDSKPSSQHPNDEANTMAERDLGSTFLLPHTHLYKPDRGSDISGFESL